MTISESLRAKQSSPCREATQSPWRSLRLRCPRSGPRLLRRHFVPPRNDPEGSLRRAFALLVMTRLGHFFGTLYLLVRLLRLLTQPRNDLKKITQQPRNDTLTCHCEDLLGRSLRYARDRQSSLRNITSGQQPLAIHHVVTASTYYICHCERSEAVSNFKN
ncbi:hypothetical protein Thein_0561 [Thermodesulfatator indicus DSM 15286]|uniref:Uncharacterized protein n=1 Tax=Thermodesulfatator indicus (strain DSM 15286 / JCM 11887 / CIR29812) TaxID=667014 RepID=F8ABD2_THEID|nr:hypothetical protein Thein_0561 [Thermodesulfatator indicus DSM 15286]